MKRLVYNPRVDVYIKADDGVYDISPFVTSCMVNRKVNQVSPAQVTFRNPKFQFTERAYHDPITKTKVWGPVFHPMDPIVITMTRLRDRPIQVFTGYCDSTPYLQLFPGLATLDASCTIKRLQYTYWDPGLPFVWEFLMNSGWQINPQFGLFNANAATKPVGKQTKNNTQKLSDSNFGKLLFDILHEIGNWPNDTIFIEKLPSEIFDMIGQLFELFKSDSQEGEQEFHDLLKQIIGTSSLGGGGGGGSSVPGQNGTLTGGGITPSQATFAVGVSMCTGLDPRICGAWVIHENCGNFNFLCIGGAGNLSSFGSMDEGIKATCNLLQGSLYTGIIKSAGGSLTEQAAAIDASPWCSGVCYGTNGIDLVHIAQTLKFTPTAQHGGGGHGNPARA